MSNKKEHNLPEIRGGSFTLADLHPDYDAEVRGSIRVEPFHSLCLGFEGYGEATAAPGHGTPVVVERYEGELRVLVWADINKEDPTHVISLENAREELYEG